jgi:outer membrane protein
MKKLLLLVFVFVFVQNLSAQKGKYGHLNSDSVLLKMPELQLADTKLKTIISELETEIVEMNTNYEELVTAYNENETTWSDLIKQNKLDEITTLSERIQQFQISAQEEVNTKRTELYSPILEKFNKAIEDVAKENGYKMVFDNGKGFLLYYDDEDDVTTLVEKKLGITN